MSIETTWFVCAIAIGVGATGVMDLWTVLLKRVFGVASLDYCLIGRWLLHMRRGRFTHARIGAAPQLRFECLAGWTAHYVIGIVFALVLVVVAPDDWLARPTLLPALLFGIGTVLVPFLVMQPSLGLGIAASRTPSPARARLKSLATHAVFGFGLYAGAVVVSWVLRIHA